MASDSDSEEDFVSFGTPLEPLEEDEPARKPVPVHEQTVKDEKGRYKRFHGAFTGGFSAGYFNTVGTKEGWTPSTFVSSRQQKAERPSARPEDFMDEEDLGEHGIAPHQISTTAEFASGATDDITKRAQAIRTHSAPIPGDTLLQDLIAPARTSIGVQLLRRMGWKEGQGVGPRTRKRKKNTHADAGQRMYGCALPQRGSAESEEESDDDDEEFAPENVTFAPKDVTPLTFEAKTDVRGLGYRGLDPSRALHGLTTRGGHIDLFSPHSDRSSQLGLTRTPHTRRPGVSGQAFDEDEDSVYHRDSMSNYDSILGGEEPGDGLFGWTAPQQYKKKRDSGRDAAYLGKILEGFTLAAKAEEANTVFPPPVLPRDYRPVRRFAALVDTTGLTPILVAALKESRGHMTQPQQTIGRHQLDSAHRREMLGETSLQGPSSVFELLRPEDQEKLRKATNQSASPVEGRRDLPDAYNQPGAQAEGRRDVPDLSSQSGRAAVVAAAKASALQALSSRFSSQQQGAADPQKVVVESQAMAAWSSPTADTKNTFKPFDKNPHKQARYDQYLTLLKQGHRDALERSLDVCMTEWERGREREEFVRAALLYKPSNSALNSRFTRSRDDLDDSSVEVARDTENDVDDKEAAVKMKMFGKLTRDTFEWHPDKLLCKRFNIPDPYPGSGVVGMPKVKRDRFSVFNFLTVNESPTAASSSSSARGQEKEKERGGVDAGSKRSRWDVSSAPPAGAEEDPLSQLLSQARTQASQSTEATQGVDKTEGAKAEEKEEKKEEEEEEEEEKRPSMDLFKAIFSSSESSSEEDEEEEEEEEEEQTNQAAGQTGHKPPEPMSFSRTPQTNQETGEAGHQPPSEPIIFKKPQANQDSQEEGLKPPGPMSFSGTPQTNQGTGEAGHQSPPGPIIFKKPQAKPLTQEEEFGPRLPPPTSGVAPPTPTSTGEESYRRRSKEKHKAKKEHKHKKEKKHKKKKKGKHKKEKEREKERRRREKREESSSSSSHEGDDDDEDDATTDELLRRLKSIRGKV